MNTNEVEGKDSPYYLAKKSLSDRTVTSSEENIVIDNDENRAGENEDCMIEGLVDITEDDVAGDVDSDTDSGSYWSAIDEDEENDEAHSNVKYSQESLAAHKTDEYIESESVHTAINREHGGSFTSREGVRVILKESGNIRIDEKIEEAIECETEATQLASLKENAVFCSTEDEASNINGLNPSVNDKNGSEERLLDNFVNEIITDEAAKLEKFPESSDVAHDKAPGIQNSPFMSLHSDIGQNLSCKTGIAEFKPQKVEIDSVDSNKKLVDPTLDVEKCLGAYDVIDQFDVRVSEKNANAVLFEPNPVIQKLHNFAVGVRRTVSFRKQERAKEEFAFTHPARRTKSDTHVFRKQPIDDFVNVEYSTRKEKNGEVVEVLVVSPNLSKGRVKEEDIDIDLVDGKSQLDEIDGPKYKLKDVEIGSADDLDGTVQLKKYSNLHDDIDIISLSGFDNGKFTDGNKLEANDSADNNLLENHEDPFDESKPTRPPRLKKIKKQESHEIATSHMKRVSSETDIQRNSERALSLTGHGKKHMSASSFDVSSLQTPNSKKKSVSDENIFKGILPFLDFDSKKKTLSGSGTKTLPANEEQLLLFTDAFPTVIPDFPQDKRSLIAKEIYTTERSFVRGLELLVKLFKRKSVEFCHLEKEEVDTVFSNVDEILDFNKGILDDVFQRINSWSDDQTIGDIFVHSADKFKMYAKYCQNYDTSEAFVKQKAKKKKDFAGFLQSCYTNPACQIGLTLPSYLITIVQRIPRYVLLLKDLLRKTSQTHPDYNNLTASVKKMEEIASYINNQLKLSQSEKALAALQHQIVGLKAYYFSGRTLVHEGPVCLMNIKRTYQCVLFNDLMVFASKGDSKQSVVDLVLDLSLVWFQDLEQLDPQTTKEDSVGLYTPDRPYTIYVGTKSAKRLWLQHIRNAIIAHISEDNPNENVTLSQRKATYTYKNGCVYSGDFLESKREGEGTMMWPNQMTYRGSWIDDERNGYGVLEYGTGEVYEGQWKNDKLHGPGTVRYRNGDEIQGEWKIGIRHGQAKITFSNGDVFEGAFKSDRIEGDGNLSCKNGMEYDGAWRRNMKYGFGKLKRVDGSVYEGSFRNDEFDGDGVLTYSDGSVYRGEFKDGQRDGCGTFTVKNGICYEGHWMYDLKDGTGTLTFPNGDKYEGAFIEDKRCGEGTLRYNNGGCYTGRWEDDKRQGHGVMEFKDGSKYDGNWTSGQRSGQGIQSYPDGSVYDGEWQFDMFDGTGTLEKPNGWKYKGQWKHGKHHGTGTLTDTANSFKFQGEWQNGKKQGKGIELIHAILYEGEFKNNKRDGRGVETAQDKTTYEGHWKLGQKHGKGAKKLLNGMVQHQVWHMGCLMDCPVLVAREVPPLQRS